jgi:hypothetical protein
MAKPPIVITTIFPPSRAISEFARMGHDLIIVGDTKTPADWQHPRCTYLSIDAQIERFSRLARLIPTRHYARKNIGYLHAMTLGDRIIETDDDNLPYNFFPNFLTEAEEVDVVRSTTGFINTFRRMLSDAKPIWPRGYPLNKITDETALSVQKVTKHFPLQQSLADQDADVDAIYRLTNNALVTFDSEKKFALAPHSYAPINSQNTYWHASAYLLMYLPGLVASRLTDIYRGYIAQRLVWELGGEVLFLSPSVYQERNPHDYLKDFAEEVPLYQRAEEFVRVLEDTPLHGSLEEKMVQVYQALIAKQFLPAGELEILRAWIDEVNRIR